MRITQGRNKSLWASYLLVTPSATVYFGGDSGYFKGFREFGRKFGGIDYAFLATTAYHPRWFMHYQHMNIPEAVKAFNELGAAYFIPTQWGTFHLGSEPAGYPGLDLKRYIKKHHLDASQFKIMDIGEIIPLK
jgi:L-ascorbate metabolism protein UlaG (beta-lactamase superfamily)